MIAAGIGLDHAGINGEAFTLDQFSMIVSENQCRFQRLFAFLATFRDGGATSWSA